MYEHFSFSGHPFCRCAYVMDCRLVQNYCYAQGVCVCKCIMPYFLRFIYFRVFALLVQWVDGLTHTHTLTYLCISLCQCVYFPSSSLLIFVIFVVVFCCFTNIYHVFNVKLIFKIKFFSHLFLIFPSRLHVLNFRFSFFFLFSSPLPQNISTERIVGMKERG